MQTIYYHDRRLPELRVTELEELYGERGRFRVLQFGDGAIQGAQDLEQPERVVLEYPRAMIHLMEHNLMQFDRAFVIGHGIGTIAGYFSDRRVITAELDERIRDISEAYFNCQIQDVRLGDGRALLAEEQSDSLDYIVVDAFSDSITPSHLVCSEFFELAADRLNPDGTILLNLIGSPADRWIHAVHSTLQLHYLYTLTFILQPEHVREHTNIIMVGRQRPIAYQARHMAGFKYFLPPQGHIIREDTQQG
ncbi:spermidine synthase [Paenibacillus massiliensis]|uniref:spermidine synthase n=1 Tax=Paenibacillus massiliensis TaxID=225917 RepID=UPI00046E662D|nr:fused MFS/spermidine synthase [Paenibacillus massiliensis]